MNQLEKNQEFGQPRHALVTSQMSNQSYFAQQAVTGELYLRQVFGPRSLKFTPESSEYGEFEARYHHDLQPGRAGWLLVYRSNQERMQALEHGEVRQERLEVLNADGRRFSTFAVDLTGRGEQLRISHAANPVHEDPVGAESGSSQVLLELSRGGKPTLDQVRITAAHGEISGLSYALEGKTEAEVLAFARQQWQSQPGKLDGRSEGQIIRHAREAFVTGIYRADQARLQSLQQDEVVLESGYQLTGLQDYTLVAGSDIFLVGKGELPEPSRGQLSLVLKESVLPVHGVVSNQTEYWLPADTGGRWQVQFSRLPPEGALVSAGQALRWHFSRDQTMLHARAGEQELIRLEAEAQSGGVTVRAVLKAGLDHPQALDSLVQQLELTLSQGMRQEKVDLMLQIIDDQPALAAQSVPYASATQNTNLMVVLDGSCMMRARMADWCAPQNHEEASRLDIARQAIQGIIEHYAAIGQVKVHFVIYDQSVGYGWDPQGALSRSHHWLDPEAAVALLNNGGLSQRVASSGVRANADQALQHATEQFTHTGRLEDAAQNKLLFVTAGMPEQAPSDAVLQRFQTLVGAENIAVRSLGVGDHLDGSGSAHARQMLASIATDAGNGQGKLVQHLIDPAKLAAMLPDGVAQINGPLMQGALGQLGGDGGYVQEIRFGSRSYLLDPQTGTLNGILDSDWQPAHAGWEWRFDPENLALHFRSATEQLGLLLARAEFSYRSYAPGSPGSQQLQFVLQDRDGDRAAGRLEIHDQSYTLVAEALPDLLRWELSVSEQSIIQNGQAVLEMALAVPLATPGGWLGRFIHQPTVALTSAGQALKWAFSHDQHMLYALREDGRDVMRIVLVDGDVPQVQLGLMAPLDHPAALNTLLLELRLSLQQGPRLLQGALGLTIVDAPIPNEAQVTTPDMLATDPVCVAAAEDPESSPALHSGAGEQARLLSISLDRYRAGDQGEWLRADAPQIKRMEGGAGNDTLEVGVDLKRIVLYGHDGDDRLIAGPGRGMAVLLGGRGHDALEGGDGHDQLLGGQGADRLTGGAGRDLFIWEANDLSHGAVDRVTDFTPAEGDQLDFSALFRAAGILDVKAHPERYLQLDRDESNVLNSRLCIRLNANEQQVVVLDGVELTTLSASGSSVEVLQTMLQQEWLLV